MADPAVVHVSGAGRHPDAGWLGRLRVALDWWQDLAATSPTSSVLGGGAVAAVEAAFSRFHGGRPALLLPSATFALRVGLQAAGVLPGDEVICSAIDWPSGFAAILSLGAIPVPVAVDEETLTMAPQAAALARTDQTHALIACHLHGICADIPALRESVPGIPIVEDVAQAFDCRLDSSLAGTLGDFAVLSLGPGKQIDAGEGGILLCDNASQHERAAAKACHPLRRLLAGLSDSDPAALSVRPHPVSAILALHGLENWSAQQARAAQTEILHRLEADDRVRPLGKSSRHTATTGYVPVLAESSASSPPPGVSWAPSGAQVLPSRAGKAATRDMRLLLDRVRLVTKAAGTAVAAVPPGAAPVSGR